MAGIVAAVPTAACPHFIPSFFLYSPIISSPTHSLTSNTAPGTVSLWHGHVEAVWHSHNDSCNSCSSFALHCFIFLCAPPVSLSAQSPAGTSTTTGSHLLEEWEGEGEGITGEEGGEAGGEEGRGDKRPRMKSCWTGLRRESAVA